MIGNGVGQFHKAEIDSIKGGGWQKEEKLSAFERSDLS